MRVRREGRPIGPEGLILAAGCMRTVRIEPRLVLFSRRERVWNVSLHPREDDLSDPLCSHRSPHPAEADITPRKVKEILPEGVPISS